MKHLEEITGRLKAEVGEWLDQQEGALLELQELEERLEGLRPSLGAKAVADASRALSGSKTAIRRTRMREAGEAIAECLRELGIRVEPGAPMKRVRRKKAERPSAKPAPEPPEARPTTASPATSTVAEAPPRERSGFLSRGRAAQ